MVKVGNSLHMLVGIVKVVVTRVTKSLVPHELFRFCLDRGYWSVLLNVLVEGHIVQR